MRKMSLLLIVCAFTTLLFSCTQQRTVDSHTQTISALLETRVVYLERIALPPGSIIKVTLEDIAKMDVSADIISYKEVIVEGAPPYNITLEYSPKRLTGYGRYVVRARIEKNGQLLFTNSHSIDAFPEDATGPVEILVNKTKYSAPQAQNHKADLINTYWKLMTLSGSPVSIGHDARESYIILKEDELGAQGYSGCNTFSGHYNFDATQISFTTLITTRKYCEKYMGAEHNFLAALIRTNSYEIAGEEMTLFNKKGSAIARFESRYLQ